MIDAKEIREKISNLTAYTRIQLTGSGWIKEDFKPTIIELCDRIDELESAESRNEYLNGLKAKITARENHINVLEEKLKVAEEALIRMRDCDWVIRLPDRMDAVRDIAREALAKIRGEK